MKNEKTVDQNATLLTAANSNSSRSEQLSDKEIHDIMETPNIVIAEALKRQEKATTKSFVLLAGLQETCDKLQRTIDNLFPDFSKNNQLIKDISNSFKKEDQDNEK